MNKNTTFQNTRQKPLGRNGLGPVPLDQENRSEFGKKIRRIGVGLGITAVALAGGALLNNKENESEKPPVTTVVELGPGDTLQSKAEEQSERLGEDPAEVIKKAQELNPESVGLGDKVALPSTSELNNQD